MELVSLHPLDPGIAERYVGVLLGNRDVPVEWAAWWSPSLMGEVTNARVGSERAANNLTYGFAQALMVEQPSFTHDGFGLSVWEARIDRGVGMLMRPPSRLFSEAGLDAAASRVMPIRLDLQQGMMGGAWIPARLIPDLERLLDARLERTARRLHEGEYDTYGMLGLMLDATSYARQHNLGLFEAMDVIGPGGEALPGSIVIRADRKRIDPEIKARIDAAIKPAKKPGLFSRMMGRSGHPVFEASVNGHSLNGQTLDPDPQPSEKD